MRRGRGWTADELRRLTAGYDTGVSVQAIAIALDTTRARVLHKARALGLVHRRWQRPAAVAAPQAEAAAPAPAAPAAPADDRNPRGPVALALFELAGRVRETRNGFVLDRCPASAFQLIAAANCLRTTQGLPPIRLPTIRRGGRHGGAWAAATGRDRHPNTVHDREGPHG
jgi:hypothetical protein